MNLSNLADYQLYEIIQNPKSDKDIKKLANDEFTNRKLSVDQIQKIISIHDAQFRPENDQALELKYKLILILFPFFIPIQSVFAGRWLAKGQKRKWKDYWFYLSLGYLFWTIIIILFARYFFFDTPTKK